MSRASKTDKTEAPLRQATRQGLAGCRAPAGRFVFEVAAWPPSKANKYEIVYAGERPRLKVRPEVETFIDEMSRAVATALCALSPKPYRVEWFVPPKRKLARPLNPLFGHDIEVDVTVRLYEPLRSVADTDGVLKATLDVLTAAGVWWDDRQVGDIHLLRASLVGQRAVTLTRVELEARPKASWLNNPRGQFTRADLAHRPAAAPPVTLH